MASESKVRANRLNAARSTGPKTAAGRARVSRNARKHGLRMPVLSSPALAAEVEARAQRMLHAVKVPDKSGDHLLEFARNLAEAEVDLKRVRDVRNDLLSTIFALIDRIADRPDIVDQLPAFMRQLSVINRYYHRARSRRYAALDVFVAASAGALEEAAGRKEAN
jgi:hypothetical protein